MPQINEFSLQLIDLITPLLTILTGIVIALWFKELAVDIMKGLSFKYMGPFKEGDKCILDGHSAVVVKIGMTVTVFGCMDDERGQYLWRYVPNDKIGGLKLAKVISNKKRELL